MVVVLSLESFGMVFGGGGGGVCVIVKLLVELWRKVLRVVWELDFGVLCFLLLLLKSLFMR